MSTLGNAASILRLFTPDRLEISVTDVEDACIPKSSASRLLKAMLQEGLLARHENSPRYKVGNLLFEVSQLYRLNSSLIELTDDVLKAICRETGHTGYLSILDGTDVLVIRMHQGLHALRVFTPLGQRAPAFEPPMAVPCWRGFRTTRCGPSIPMASVCRRPTRRRASTN